MAHSTVLRVLVLLWAVGGFAKCFGVAVNVNDIPLCDDFIDEQSGSASGAVEIDDEDFKLADKTWCELDDVLCLVAHGRCRLLPTTTATPSTHRIQHGYGSPLNNPAILIAGALGIVFVVLVTLLIAMVIYNWRQFHGQHAAHKQKVNWRYSGKSKTAPVQSKLLTV